MSEQTEKEFLEQYSADKYRKPSLTVDVVVFTVRDERLQVLLVERGGHPFRGCLALPGGFLDPEQDESLLQAALRELKEETGIEPPYLEQLGAYGSRDRDPRDWVATVVYFVLLSAQRIAPQAGSDASGLRWLPIEGEGIGRPMAFDHAEILRDAVVRLWASLAQAAPADA